MIALGFCRPRRGSFPGETVGLARITPRVPGSLTGPRPAARLFAVVTVLAAALFAARKPTFAEGVELLGQLQPVAADSSRVPPTPGPAPVIRANQPGGQEPVERQALVAGPYTSSAPAPDSVLAEIPDPVYADKAFELRMTRLKALVAPQDERVVLSYQRTIDKAREYLKMAERPEQVRLSLSECIQRALANNYTIRGDAYSPAIARTRLVEAEAAFDAVFFLDANWANTDQATAIQLAANQSDARSYGGGFRMLMPTGTRIQTELKQSRSFTDLQFATLNPAYNTNFVTTFSQPLLRGFGLDYNRAPIEIARLDFEATREQFTRSVRDRLFEVERAYWLLAQVRRLVLITAETTAQNYVTYEYVVGRLGLDATPVEVNNSLSQWKTSEVGFANAVKAVRDAEDSLKYLLNDPELLLSKSIDIVPEEIPFVSALTLDQFAEVRTAIERRSELREAKLRIEQSRVKTARAKNDTMPDLSVNFSYDVSGLGLSADTSFDSLTTNRFRSYTVGVSFEMPIGNRAREAAYRRSRMEETQAIIALQRVSDGVVQEVNNAIREMIVSYVTIPPSLDAVIAAERNLRSLQARAESISPAFLQTELNAVQQIGTTRRNLLQVIMDYNVAMAALERAKGTLLEYNNVVLSDAAGNR